MSNFAFFFLIFKKKMAFLNQFFYKNMEILLIYCILYESKMLENEDRNKTENLDSNTIFNKEEPNFMKMNKIL